MVKIIKESKFKDLYDDIEKWNQPEFYSLILQPFIISPSINVSDIMVAIKLQSNLSVEDAIRKMHPFPILERFVDKNIVANGEILVKAPVHVLMFMSDLVNHDFAWPLFGGGARICAGQHLAMPLIRTIHNTLNSAPNYDPCLNHKYSGRNNDKLWSWGERFYFLKTIAYTIWNYNPQHDMINSD
jgi:hypothetical protein